MSDQESEPTIAEPVPSEEAADAIPVEPGSDAKDFAARVAAQYAGEIGATVGEATGEPSEPAKPSEPDPDVTGVVADLLGAIHSRDVEETASLLDDLKAATIAGQWPDVLTAIEIVLPGIDGSEPS